MLFITWAGLLVLLLREHRHVSKPAKSRRWSGGGERNGQCFFYKIVHVSLLRWPLLHRGMDVTHKGSGSGANWQRLGWPCWKGIGRMRWLVTYTVNRCYAGLDANSLALYISEIAPYQTALASRVTLDSFYDRWRWASVSFGQESVECAPGIPNWCDYGVHFDVAGDEHTVLYVSHVHSWSQAGVECQRGHASNTLTTVADWETSLDPVNVA